MKQTSLHRAHLSLKAKMTDFAGWDMPVSYNSILAEHRAVRTGAGIFDIGHMGLINLTGNDVLNCLQVVTTNDVAKLPAFSAQYSLLCNEKGGVVDDVLVYRLEEGFLMVANAVNTAKVLGWLRSRFSPYAQITPLEETHSAISLQGPKAIEILQPLTGLALSDLRKNQVARTKIQEIPVLLSRTGYTGEDGFEFFLEKAEAKKTWDLLLAQGAVPCGLGARDTLRLEAALPLYGHEYTEEISPLEAGYKWAVKTEKGDFVGKEALQKIAKEGLPQKLVGLAFDCKAIPRQGFPVFKTAEGSEEIGTITSGSISPTLNHPIALAYLRNHREHPKEVYVKIRNGLVKAVITALPFYKKQKGE